VADVHVVDRFGRLGTVPQADLHAALKDGARLASPEEEAASAARKEFGGPADTALAGALGAARGLTGPLTDIAVVEAAGALGGQGSKAEARRILEGEKLAHPYATPAGEALGFLGGGVAGAGLGEAAGLAGGAAEGLAGTLGAAGAETLGGRALQAGIRQAARFGAEGGIYGGLSEADESYLKDKPLTAEHVVGAIGHGAFFGALVGGPAGLASELVPAASKAVLGKAGGILGRAAEAADLDAERMAVKVFEPTPEETRALDALPGGVKAAGRELLDRKLLSAGDNLENAVSKVRVGRAAAEASLADEVAHVATTSGEMVPASRVRAVLEELQPAETELASTRANAAREIQGLVGNWEERATREMSLRPGAGGADATIRGADALVPLRSVVDFQRTVRAAAASADSPVLRQAAERLGTLTYESAAAAAEGAQAKRLAELATSAERLTMLERIGDAALTRPRPTTPVRWLPIATAAMHLNPVAIAKGLAISAAANVIRRRGPSTAAVALDRLAAIGGIGRIARRSEEELADAAGAFLRRKGPARPGAKTGALGDLGPEKKYLRALEMVRSIASDPHAGEHLQGSLSRLESHAPGVAAQVTKTLSRITTYLLSKVPPDTTDPADPLPHLHAGTGSLALKDEFMAAWEVAQHPDSVAQELREGHVNLDTMEALRAMFPAKAEYLKRTMMEQLASMEEPPPYQQLLHLSILFDTPLDMTMQPEFIRDVQDAYVSDQRQRVGMAQPSRENLTLKSLRDISTPAGAVMQNDLPRGTG
jgi:hypothetical protein